MLARAAQPYTMPLLVCSASRTRTVCMPFSLLLLLPCALLTVATSAAAFVGLVTTSRATTALATAKQ